MTECEVKAGEMEKIDDRPVRVFDDGVVRFLGGLSADLFRSPLVRRHPDLSAFAFFARKGNLERLHEELRPEEGRLGRGLCFHVTPANIPVNFAFSWVFALLAGNANIVRLPSKVFPQSEALLAIVQEHLATVPELARRNVFVRYPRTDMETTATYSAMADCRMIWGGDSTIAALKALPTKPRCVDVAFADRYSVALIDGEAVLAADSAHLERLAEGFYNDTYLMDQNACSSPQLILWERDSAEARARFWGAVSVAAGKKYGLQDAVAVDKYTQFCEEAVRNPAVRGLARDGNLLYRVELDSLETGDSGPLERHRGRGGFFFEHPLENREELFEAMTEKFQTVTCFGIDAEGLRRQVVSRGLKGIDRIVPVGRAMDIGAVWDGMDLVRTLSRRVELR